MFKLSIKKVVVIKELTCRHEYLQRFQGRQLIEGVWHIGERSQLKPDDSQVFKIKQTRWKRAVWS